MMFRSYWSYRLSLPIAMTSRKPSVVISAVRAPLRSMIALVASVVPWMIRPMSPAATPEVRMMVRTPSITPCSGAAGVVSTLMVVRVAARAPARDR